MIPIPLQYVTAYNVTNETDEDYKNLVLAELKWINKHQEYIVQKMMLVYQYFLLNIHSL